MLPVNLGTADSAKDSQFLHCLHPNVLCRFVAALMEQELTHKIIKCYLSAVHQLHIQYGHVDSFASALPQLTFVLRGVGRTQGEGHTRQRLLITPMELTAIKAVSSQQPLSYDAVMLWTACCTGFFGFLRAGEFTLSSLSVFDPTPHLAPEDITTDSHERQTLVRLHLKQSKTDPFGRDADVCLARSANDICPVSSLLAYMAGRALVRGRCSYSATVVPYLVSDWYKSCSRRCRQQVLDCSGFTCHCFRIGAVSTAKARLHR